MTWDVFISHASEDKADVARPLAEMLKAKGLNVWYDEYSLQIGDSLRLSIDKGLRQSRYGIVILSPHFFEKQWPRSELDGLVSLESGKNTILPVWHNVTAEQVKQFSPMLAGRVGVSSDSGLDNLVAKIIKKVCLYRIADHRDRVCYIDVSECVSKGAPIVPPWLETNPERMGSTWLVERLKKAGTELRLYFKLDWCGGTWFVVDVQQEDGIVINCDQCRELMPSTATTTTTLSLEGKRQDPITLDALYAMVGGKWLLKYIWQGVPVSEIAIIARDGSYSLTQFPNRPRFRLADARYDPTKRELIVKKVSIVNGREAEAWDTEELTLSEDGSIMTGTSRRFGRPLEYIRIAPEDSMSG